MIDALLAPLQYEFGVRALLAAALVGVVCAVVGSYMVLRGLAFMGDADQPRGVPRRRHGVPVRRLALPRRRDRGGRDGARDRLDQPPGPPAIGHDHRRALRGHVRPGRRDLQRDPELRGRPCSAFCSANVLGIGLGDLIGLAVLAASSWW